MGGWGQPHGPSEEQLLLREADRVIKLGDRLAATVRCWEEYPSMNNREAMLEACRSYEGELR